MNDSQASQETRSKVRQSPNLFGLSVGFKFTEEGAKKILDKNNDVIGIEFTEIILMEVTVTGKPANTETTARAKSESETESSIESLRNAIGALRKQVDELTHGVKDTELKPSSPVAQTVLSNASHRERLIILLELGKSDAKTFGENEGD